MYAPPHIVPAWAGVLAWAISALSLAVAAIRLARRRTNVLGLAGAVALVAALRLLEFPLHGGYALGGSALALGFAVVVFGADAAAWALAAATFAHGVVVESPVDVWTLGFNVAIYAGPAPWLLFWAYRTLKRSFPSRPAGYVVAFATGAVGAPLAAALAVGSFALATGALPGRLAWAGVASGLTLTAAEGVLAAWGYTFALSRGYAGDGVPPRWAPSRRAGVVMIIAGLAVAGLVAPAAPGQVGALGPARTAALVGGLPYGVRALAGLASEAVAAGAAAIMLAPALLLAGRRRRGENAA